MRNRCHQSQRIVILINAEGIVQISFYFALGRAGKFSFIVRQLAEDRLILCRKIICEDTAVRIFVNINVVLTHIDFTILRHDCFLVCCLIRTGSGNGTDNKVLVCCMVRWEIDIRLLQKIVTDKRNIGRIIFFGDRIVNIIVTEYIQVSVFKT